MPRAVPALPPMFSLEILETDRVARACDRAMHSYGSRQLRSDRLTRNVAFARSFGKGEGAPWLGSTAAAEGARHHASVLLPSAPTTRRLETNTAFGTHPRRVAIHAGGRTRVEGLHEGAISRRMRPARPRFCSSATDPEGDGAPGGLGTRAWSKSQCACKRYSMLRGQQDLDRLSCARSCERQADGRLYCGIPPRRRAPTATGVVVELPTLPHIERVYSGNRTRRDECNARGASTRHITTAREVGPSG